MRDRFLLGLYILIRLFIAYCWFVMFFISTAAVVSESQSGNERYCVRL